MITVSWTCPDCGAINYSRIMNDHNFLDHCDNCEGGEYKIAWRPTASVYRVNEEPEK